MDLLTVCIYVMIVAVETRGLGRFTDAVIGDLPIPLDMADLSIDDDYNGCSQNMRKQVDSKYLPREKYGYFGLAWKHATEAMKNKKPKEDNLTMEHAIALRVYTYGYPYNIYRSLNDDVREGKNKYKKNDGFRFHALHFLLTDAIQRLRKDCMVTYRGTNITFTRPTAKVRFGAFTSTSKDENVALRFGAKTCFEVETCHGASLSKYSDFEDEQEVLIPPYEVFKVVRVYSNPMDQPKSFKN